MIATGKGKNASTENRVYRDYFDKSCLTNLVTFYNEVTELEGKGRATTVISQL